MKKRELIFFIIFLTSFLIIYIYHNKINFKNRFIGKEIVSLKQVKKDSSVRISEDKQDTEIIEEPGVSAGETDKKIDVEKSIILDKVIEGLPEERKIIKKSELTIPEWIDFIPGNIEVKYLIEINKDGFIENQSLLKSSGIYSLDKAVFDFIRGLEFEENKTKTKKILKIILSYD